MLMAAYLGERWFRLEPQRANMRHWKCAMGTKPDGLEKVWMQQLIMFDNRFQNSWLGCQLMNNAISMRR